MNENAYFYFADKIKVTTSVNLELIVSESDINNGSLCPVLNF